MSSINDIDTSNSYAWLFGSSTGTTTSANFGIDLGDYAMVKNGTYKKLMKAYYAQAEAEKSSGTTDSSTKLTSIQNGANALSKSMQALMSDSLWEKKTTTTKDETTGEETTTTDYDWDAITKAVSVFVSDYNDMIDELADSYTKSVLKNAIYMVKQVSANQNLLSQIGITVGSGNKLTLDEDALKSADIGTLKSLFSGSGSFAERLSLRAAKISSSAASAGGNATVYTSSGTVSTTLSSLVSSKIDTET